ncbi:MAG: glycine--tRNA ligase subunit beta [Rubrivivax sp.]|nr:glycine--tRNA ligase subunit beta [Rubrivivax sp.]
MTSTKNLLVELFVEELPPKALKKLGEAFGAALLDGLRAAGLAGEGSVLNGFATPRRLAAHVSHVLAVAPDRAASVKLMPAAVALDAAGAPTAALHKKLAALGVASDPDTIAGLRRVAEGKAELLYLDTVVPGATLAAGLQKALDEAIAKLPIPKVMQYQLDSGEGAHFQPGWTSVHFVRPAHGLVALHGADVVPVQALGLVAGRQTRGHRFEATFDPVVLQDADHYERQLAEQGAVVASFAARRGEIVRQLAAAAAREGLVPVDDDALLDEVTALVERPNVLVCGFPREFLAVPQECLILTMKANQKYFPLLDAEGRLSHRFLVVSNISPADASRVVQGNERVVRPRLADAKFFFDQDRRRTLESRVPELARVVYHGKLGSQGERVERVRLLARRIGQELGGESLAALADRAALLAKADLLTDMVGEFPELQGVMGGYYARHDGEPEAVALAIEDHYRPRFAGDGLPRGDAGLAVALADKLETLAGLFGIGQLPTGDKDPFALRRHALGVIRMLVERDLPLAVPALVDMAFEAFAAGLADARGELTHFLYERLIGWLREAGYSAQEVDAVVALRPPRWAELPQRLAAVRAFAALPEAAALAAANKRVGNILKKSEAGDAALAPAPDAALLREPAEAALAAALQAVEPQAEAAFARGEHTASLQALAALKAPVDAFFDHVMVNADDPALRRNRLALLARLHRAMNRVADLSRLAA